MSYAARACRGSLGASLGIAKSTQSGIYGPFDLELHQGEDGLLYVVDAARLFPPECRVNPGVKQMYQLLRPELLHKAGKPLVSDA
jgi:hypothetical protein